MSQDKLNDILEIVQFMQDNMVTHDELDVKLAGLEDRIMTRMDGFIGLHQKLDLEMVAMRARYDRLEDQIQQIAKHVQLKLQ